MPSSAINVYCGTELENDQWHVFTVGAGSATAVLSTTQKGGRYLLSSGATGSSLGSLQPHGSGSFIDNPKATAWYLYVRGKVTTAIDANSYVAINGLATPGRTSPAIAMGVVLPAVSTTNFTGYAQNNAGVTQISKDLGVPIDTADHDWEMWNDGATLFFAIDSVTVGSGANTNVGTNPVTIVLQIANGATASNRAMDIDTILCAIAG